jgi:hypothetical protein
MMVAPFSKISSGGLESFAYTLTLSPLTSAIPWKKVIKTNKKFLAV